MAAVTSRQYWGCVFLTLLLFLFSFFCRANQLDGVRVWPSPDSTRVVFDLSSPPKYSYFMLHSPERLVIDLTGTSTKFDFSKLSFTSDLVEKVRTSQPDKAGELRVVLELKQTIHPVLFPLSPTKPYGERLVIDVFAERKAKPERPPQMLEDTKRDIIVAVDAGHGGEDPGSIGSHGTYEKVLTLDIAKRLQRLINAEQGMKAVMTRTGDYYVGLDRRTEKARKLGADLLVSIHADAFISAQPRGASVWVLSMRRANSEIGRWMEQTERHSELLGGAADVIQSAGNEQYVARALLDMSMDRAMVESHAVANQVVKQLGHTTRMHKKAPVSASLAVLKSPDIPSLLVETGFISNPKEEQQLRTSRHQQALAQAIFKGIKAYFVAKPPQGTLFAALHNRSHVVVQGDSLSVLARRYHTSVGALKKANKLSSNVIHVGQKLMIPAQ